MQSQLTDDDNWKKKSNLVRNILIVLVIAGAAFLLFSPWLWLHSSFSGANSVAIIHILGPIGSENLAFGNFSSSANTENLIRYLKLAREDNQIAAVVLRIDSPGGTAASGQEIYAEVKKLRRKKPVISSIADVGTSAAYLIASAGDKILASRSSLVGGIGTIVIVPNYSGLLEKLGINYTVISQGKYKDLGSPNRPLTSQEKHILKDQARVVYQQFINQVSAGRHLPRKKVRRLANGLAYLGTKAKKIGLIDEIGTINDAVDLAAKLGKIKGRPRVVNYQESSFFQLLTNWLLGQGLQVKLQWQRDLMKWPQLAP